MVLALLTDGMFLSAEEPLSLLPQALSTVVEAAATPVAIRKFLREKDMLSLPRGGSIRAVGTSRTSSNRAG
ncbi:hypothetical protein GCM10010121_020290 [Streptomyces brasiliensis]|uniref:Uncharacterized protein n=1 Tax=Streptomyces brasiliensis TaxID=1954 RepID=A0A917KDX2_9ACTN|nr:hypothetical protein GCM10010121_020290 [Streptomyces brasiliensis]